MSEHVVGNEIPITILDVTSPFSRLTEKEKKYVHYISQASWIGSKICLIQTSLESPIIFDLFQKLFHLFSVDELKAKSGLNDQSFNHFLNYVVTFYSNMGNYSSFGDQKFIPALSKEDLDKIFLSTHSEDILELYKQCAHKIYSLDPNEKELAYPEKGTSTYYSPNVTLQDINFIGEYLNENKISPYNTRLFKIEDKQDFYYQLRFASIETKSYDVQFKGKRINIFYGDYSSILVGVVNALENALPFAANDNQKKMLIKYIDHFRDGNIDNHKDSQRWWIKDKGPTVEMNMGFIESYRDPHGVRGEWEGFVAVVDKEMSAKFGALVENAEAFIAELPWGKVFEKDKFLRPDFTSLELVSYASSGIPLGINIPNYDDIRQNEGFKNVSLGNVLRARSVGEKVTFLRDEDQSKYDKLIDMAFEVQVGIHELLGHGSGKLFFKDANGNFNFDKNCVINPLTNKHIETWYEANEDYNSKFQNAGQTIEECRAECCGLYLCTNRKLLSIFGIEGDLAVDVIYVNWLAMVRKGLLALEFYSPETNKWRQAHMQARFVILNVLREAGGIVEIKEGPFVVLDASKIETIGRAAIGGFLTKIMVYKATANVDEANKLYNHYSTVTGEYLNLRKIVIEKKTPRKVFVQSHTYLDNGLVKLQSYDPTSKGLINSFISRFGPVH